MFLVMEKIYVQFLHRVESKYHELGVSRPNIAIHTLTFRVDFKDYLCRLSGGYNFH